MARDEATMNIFVLDRDPVAAAQMQFDRHVIKMVLETAQLLCAAFPEGAAPYKRTHYNHPCGVWARASRDNFRWLATHGLALADEYEFRYGKVHASRGVILWCVEHLDEVTFPAADLSPFALAMPDEYKRPDAVEAYRTYYRQGKAAIARWGKNRPAPEWWAD